MKTMDVKQLKALFDKSANFQLIDVREENEYNFANIKGELIPLSEVPQNIEKISRDKPVIIHCRSGVRSGQAIQFLESNHDFDNLYNLEGGILEWSNQIDPSVLTY